MGPYTTVGSKSAILAQKSAIFGSVWPVLSNSWLKIGFFLAQEGLHGCWSGCPHGCVLTGFWHGVLTGFFGTDFLLDFVHFFWILLDFVHFFWILLDFVHFIDFTRFFVHLAFVWSSQTMPGTKPSKRQEKCNAG